MSFFSINDFKHQLNKAGGFARGHLFKCWVYPPAIPELQTFRKYQSRYLTCKSAKLPSFRLNTTKLHYMTHEVPVPGSRTNDPFTVTFYGVNDYNAYEFFTTWQKLINSPESNTRGVYDGRKKIEDPSKELPVHDGDGQLIYGDIRLEHFSPESSGNAFLESTPLLNLLSKGDNIPVAGYMLRSAYPSVISGLEFDQDGDSTIQTFTVEFNYLNFDYNSMQPSNFSDSPLEPVILLGGKKAV